ncbi:hypothetical protein EXE51_08405 [Halorubrum sp. CGM5_25_10-8B]|uniref:hypothetical protein n=1 Tax=Halorubrum sp. CGM5_25_10-8B TaxID=2518115 RepID=UPI0010F82E20|nr:hypothetical protein [Halorubrum sp. CGM5_25_10-8B]TKX37081.1 hypothetical protein EXE51_08405 [Halorubrum sp. CGM5_25_10-8B]
MTFDIETDALERVRYEAEQLHELAVNHFGYNTEHVLFTAHADGTISGRIALYVAGDYHDYEHDDANEADDSDEIEQVSMNARDDTYHDQDRDPGPPGVGATVPRPSTDATTDTAETGA